MKKKTGAIRLIRTSAELASAALACAESCRGGICFLAGNDGIYNELAASEHTVYTEIGFCERLLRLFGPMIDVPPDFSVHAFGDCESFVSELSAAACRDSLLADVPSSRLDALLSALFALSEKTGFSLDADNLARLANPIKQDRFWNVFRSLFFRLYGACAARTAEEEDAASSYTPRGVVRRAAALLALPEAAELAASEYGAFFFVGFSPDDRDISAIMTALSQAGAEVRGWCGFEPPRAGAVRVLSDRAAPCPIEDEFACGKSELADGLNALFSRVRALSGESGLFSPYVYPNDGGGKPALNIYTRPLRFLSGVTVADAVETALSSPLPDGRWPLRSDIAVLCMPESSPAACAALLREAGFEAELDGFTDGRIAVLSSPAPLAGKSPEILIVSFGVRREPLIKPSLYLDLRSSIPASGFDRAAFSATFPEDREYSRLRGADDLAPSVDGLMFACLAAGKQVCFVAPTDPRYGSRCGKLCSLLFEAYSSPI